MHIFNMCGTYLQSIEKKYGKPLGGVDFTKYALPTIIVYNQWSKMTMLKNAVNLSKIIFLSL